MLQEKLQEFHVPASSCDMKRYPESFSFRHLELTNPALMIFDRPLVQTSKWVFVHVDIVRILVCPGVLGVGREGVVVFWSRVVAAKLPHQAGKEVGACIC